MDDSPPQSQGSCTSFWGPFRPLVGGHTLGEAASSSYLPPLFVLFYRLLFAAFMLGTFINFLVIDRYRMIFFTVWSHVLLGVIFLYLALLTLAYMFAPRDKRSTDPSFFGGLGVVLFQTIASAALFLDVVYWALLFDHGSDTADFVNLTGHAFNFALVLLEMLLSLRMAFKLFYSLFFAVYLIVFLAFMWVRYAVTNDFVYDIYDFRGKPAVRIFLYYFGSFLWCFVASFVMIIVSRLGRLPCVPQFQVGSTPKRRAQDEEQGRPFDNYK